MASQDTIHLTAGALSAEFAGGNLRDIRWHGLEAIRAIAYLVRDENWGNCEIEISDLQIDEQRGGFHLSYRATAQSRSGAIMAIDVSINGSADGHLRFDARATPDSDFMTNRCGFCILHPIVGVAGSPVTVEHVDGTIEQSRFPDMIDPAQPFMAMRAITHIVTEGVTAECRMDGGTFEMEDQRNWTDASYKTYVRPLALPWPYTIGKGQTDHQTITLTLTGQPRTIARIDPTAPVTLEIGPPDGTVPAFGLGLRPDDLTETHSHIEALNEIAPRHLILYFSPIEGHGAAVLTDYAALLDAYPAAATLEYVLPCRSTPQAELADLAEMVSAAGLTLAALAVSPAPDLKSTPPGSTWPPCPPLDEVYAAARAAFPGIRLGGGMFSYFTELNRKRPHVALLDFITHTTAPLVHAADDRSVMETLEALPFVTRSVRAFAGTMPYRIGPSAIGMRHNPYGAALNANPSGRKMTMVAEDPRQREPFAAAWMVGYAAAVAPAKLEMLALGSLAGPFGVVDGGTRHPAFAAASALSRLSGTVSRRVISSDPARVLALAGGDMLLVANLTPKSVRVDLDGSTLTLPPYGIVEHGIGGAS